MVLFYLQFVTTLLLGVGVIIALENDDSFFVHAADAAAAAAAAAAAWEAQSDERSCIRVRRAKQVGVSQWSEWTSYGTK